MIFLRQLKKNIDKAGMLWVENVDGNVVIEPGEVRGVEFMIRQSDTHSATGRYTGVAFLHTNQLNFIVVPSGADHPEGRGVTQSKRQVEPRTRGSKKTAGSEK